MKAGLFAFAAILAVSLPLQANELRLARDDRVLILAPHPDDEVLGCAGIISQARRLGLPLRVVFATNGDDNEAAFMKYRLHPVLTRVAALRLGEVRRQEALGAARVLGLAWEQVVFLGYPDRGLAPMWTSHWRPAAPFRSALTRAVAVEYGEALRPGAAYLGDELLRDLEAVIGDLKPTKVFVSHPADRHPDHRALEAFTRVALWELRSSAAVFPYLVHFRRWPRPLGLHAELDLSPPGYFKAVRWITFPLDPSVRRRKHAALVKHRSQVGYSAKFLLAFVRANELFGDFPLVTAGAHSHRLTAPAKKESAQEPSAELSQQERVYFVGLESKSVSCDEKTLTFRLGFSRRLPRGVHLAIFAFGFRPGVAFPRMPKIEVIVSRKRHWVRDQGRALPADAVAVERSARQVSVRIALELLGRPRYVLTSSETRRLGKRLDWVAWRVVEIIPPR